MTYSEICKLINFNPKESKLFMPNEIFEELKVNITKTPHVAFAYTYIYFVTWLYRYAKYFNVNEVIDNKKIKEVLGYNSKTQTLDYLIKKGGFLDTIEYLETTRDYPITWEFSKVNDESLSFFMSSEIDEDMSDYLQTVPKRFFLKRPIKAFYRTGQEPEDEEEYELAGTFFDVSNTHNIPFEVFLYCVSNESIGCAGFYLYSYLKHKNDLFEEGYDVSLDALSDEIGMPKRTLNRHLGYLKSYRLIDFRHNQEFFAVGMKKEDRKANTYIIRDFEFFSESPVSFNKMKFMSDEKYKDYLKVQGDKAEMKSYVESQVPF
jgi:hypothetical protein